MNDRQTINALRYLARIVEAGERGYAVCAANMENPELKILLKSHAQQRARFKDEILAEIKRLGGSAKPRSSIRGILHRGRIDIFATLTAGKENRERIVLNEVMVGESVALRTYENLLKMELPTETRRIISRQYDEVVKVVDQIRLIRGLDGKRMIVQLFDTKKDSSTAVKKLKDADLRLTAIERIDIHDSVELYQGRGTTVLETGVSGAVGGALWGSIIGALAATSMEQAANLVPFGTIQNPAMWSLIAFAGIFGGAVIGTIIGLIIGFGISEEDAYQYDKNLKNGQILILATVENSQVHEVQRIMSGVQSVEPA